jgi:Dolichyl-phosphate-mannose-protein mannosyltransferase
MRTNFSDRPDRSHALTPVESQRETAEANGGARLPESASWIGVAALSAFFLATSIYISAHRLFWFDELFTVMYAGLPNWHAISDALAHADNQTPVSYYLLIWPVDRLFGNIQIAARLPSALAMTAGLLITFDCVRRLTDGLAGLTAVAFLSCSFLPYYGYEARSYGIYFMLGALSLWLWSYGGRDRKIPAAFFGLTLFAATLVHYYSVLLIVPYALWELTQWRPWRRPSAKMIAGVIGLACGLSLLISQIRGAAGRAGTFWSPPSLYALQQTYSDLFPSGLFLMALVLIWIVVARTARGNDSIPAMASEESLGWLFLTIPLAGFVVAELVTRAFVPRYFIGTLPGVALAVSSLLWRRFLRDHSVRFGVVALLASVGIYEQLQVVRHPESVNPFGQQTQTREILSMEEAFHKDGKQYIFCSNPMLFLEAFYYSRTPAAYVYLVASPEDTKIATTHLLLALGRYYPLHFWNLTDLKIHARETALVEPNPTVLEEIRKAGIQTVVQEHKPLRTVYLE